MASIDDFIKHRWEDAKEALRGLDGEFVSKLESQCRLESLGLRMPRLYSVAQKKPMRLLSTEWHRLLGSCMELSTQTRNVQVAANGVTSEANSSLTSYEAGLRSTYYVRSWFIHANALAERAHDVIEKSVEAYISDSTAASEIRNRNQKTLRDQVFNEIKKLRNEFVHATGSEADELTKQQLWEGLVTIGMTPERILDEFFYEPQGRKAIQGQWDIVSNSTMLLLDFIGFILNDLEADIKGQVEQ